MRAFVFLLILSNLLFLAWTQGYFGSPTNPDAFRVQQQLLADQVKVVAIDELPAETAGAEKAAKGAEKKATGCILLSDLPVPEAARFESLLAEKFPAFKAVRTTIAGSVSYWVSIPPLASKKDVDNKVAELKKFGVTDMYVVQESGPNNRAISLGLFSSKEAAAAHLEMLRSKGVKSARVVERNVKPESASLEIRGPDEQADSLRQTIAESLPGSKPAVCKPQSSAAQ
jgi:hypothetical protein